MGAVILDACHADIEEIRRKLGGLKDNPRELLRLLEETRRSLFLHAQTEGFARDADFDRLLDGSEGVLPEMGGGAPMSDAKKPFLGHL